MKCAFLTTCVCLSTCIQLITSYVFSVRSGLRLESLCHNSLSGGYSGLALGRTSFCARSGLQGLQCVQSQQRRLWWHCFQQWKHPNCQRYKYFNYYLIACLLTLLNLIYIKQTRNLHKLFVWTAFASTPFWKPILS